MQREHVHAVALGELRAGVAGAADLDGAWEEDEDIPIEASGSVGLSIGRVLSITELVIVIVAYIVSTFPN